MKQDEHGGGAPSALMMLERLLAAHRIWFDVERDYPVSGRVFPGFAVLHSNSFQYVASKNVRLWETSSHEYLFFDATDYLTCSALDETLAFIKKEGVQFVCLEENHMATNLSLVIVAERAEEGVASLVKRVRWRKNYAWGLKGWTDLRCAVVDLSKTGRERVVTNAAGRQLRQTLEANTDLSVAECEEQER